MPPARNQVFNLSVGWVAICFLIRVFWGVWTRYALTLAFNIVVMLRTSCMVPLSLSAIIVLFDICPVKNRCKRVRTFVPLCYNWCLGHIYSWMFWLGVSILGPTHQTTCYMNPYNRPQNIFLIRFVFESMTHSGAHINHRCVAHIVTVACTNASWNHSPRTKLQAMYVLVW